MSSKPSFVCKRCKQTLRLDNSLSDLSESAVETLLAPLGPNDAPETTAEPNSTSTLDNVIRNRSDALGFSSSRRVPGLLSSDIVTEPTNAITPNASSPLVGGGRKVKPGPSESFVVLSRSQASSGPNAARETGRVPESEISSGETTTSNQNPNHAPESGSSTPLPLRPKSDDRTSLSYRIKVATRVFDILSRRSDIEYPICQDCTEMLLEGLKKKTADVRKEMDCYSGALENLSKSIPAAEERERLEKEIEEIRRKEEKAIETIKDIEKQREDLRAESAELEAEERELDELNERYWEEYNSFQLSLQSFQNERDSVNLKYDHDTRELEKLQKTNVYNDAFRIGHDGHFGTINGFRLGRLPNQPVEWSEINGAWGQTVLLVYTIANKLGFRFRNYRLVPLGSFSRIERIDGDKSTYELYGSGDLHIGRLFLNRRFDHAMVAFLNCLKQLGDFAESQDAALKLPYRINKDKIGDVSIRLQFNQDEAWTRALKYTLTNTKWLLAFASGRAGVAASRQQAGSG